MSPSILVVDSDLESASRIQRVLQSCGFNVRTASSHADALKKVSTASFSLFVVDVFLGGPSGLDLCEALRSPAETKSTPIILTNGAYEPQSLPEKTRSVYGLAAILQKPLRYDSLMELVCELTDVPFSGKPSTNTTLLVPKGGLSEIPLHELLVSYYLAAVTGWVEIAFGDVMKKILFLEGIPFGAVSNLRSESLGQHLVRSGRITDDQLGQVVEMMLERGVPSGVALIDLGILPKKDLYEALKQQAFEGIVNAFSWREGVFHFVEDKNFLAFEQIFHFNLAYLYQRGVLLSLGEEEVRRRMATVSAKGIQPAACFEVGAEQFELSTDRKRNVLKFEPKTEDLQTVLDQFTFLQFGFLDANEETIQMESPYAATPDLFSHEEKEEVTQWVKKTNPSLGGRTDLLKDGRQLEEEILYRYLESRKQNLFEVLGVETDASVREIKKHYYQLAKKYHPDRLRGKLGPEVMVILENLFGLVHKAYETLSKEESRYTYTHELMPQLDRDRRENKRSREDAVQAEALFLQGQRALSKGDFRQARDLFAQAHHKDNVEPQYNMSLVWTEYLLTSEKEEVKRKDCREEILACLRVDPNLSRAKLYLGVLLVEEGQRSAGINEFQEILRRSPNDPLALKALEITIQQGDLGKCLSELLFPA